MGQKVNPISNRLGIIRGWDSNWYGGKKYGDTLLEDNKIRKYLRTRLAKASVSRIIIERTLKMVTVTICTARPGMIIGKGGEDVKNLQEELKKLTDKDVQINIHEVKRPELDAELVAAGVARQIENKVAYRRAVKMAIQSTMRIGAEGIKIQVSGRLNGAEMSRSEMFKEGRTPLHTLRADIDYALVEALTKVGIIGATGSGKSWLDYAVVIPKRLCALRGQGAAVMLGNTQGTLARNILEPMRDIWGEGLVGNISSDNTAQLFGRRVHILGADNRKHVARIQGMTIEYAYGDEMTTWHEEVFQMLKSRLRCAHSYFDGTANPADPHHFVKTFIDSDADVFCQTSTIDDNPFLPTEFVENLKREYAGTVYYNRFILGQWMAAEGIIYRPFADSIAAGDRRFYWPPDQPLCPWRVQIGVDFGGNGFFPCRPFENAGQCFGDFGR